MARLIGYARVSTTDQDLGVQKTALEKAGCGIIFEEKLSGTKRTGRDQLDLALKVLGDGDVLTVTRLDRLGRSLRDLANIAHEIENKGAALRVIEQSVDTGTSAGRAFFGMLATFAQFETDVRRERQMEGIARVKKSGERRKDGRLKYAGRKPTVDPAPIRAMAFLGKKPSEIANDLGISRMTVWRVLKVGTKIVAPPSAPETAKPTSPSPPVSHHPNHDPTQRGARLRAAIRARAKSKLVAIAESAVKEAKKKKKQKPKPVR
jgi:DNA invertase Pin-like site-specific DNA recombinase